jgi:subtilisin family serine protease
MACPHVAGLAGLILSRNPQLSNQQVRQLLASTTQDLGAAGRDTYYGYGRVNAYSALSQTPGSGSSTPVPGYTPEPTTPDPGYGYGYYDPLCGAGYGYMAGIALIGLGLAHFSHRRDRKQEK